MLDVPNQARPVRAALFLDFDNVYSSLLKVSRSAAHKFAHDPRQWMRWFESGAPEDTEIEVVDSRPRRLLIRRCYLNPASYGNERAAFTRSGFSVIDCPSLTAQGKSSADIYMVMDIMDALTHRTLIEEFIILSSDADFTPVLLRLREHDRRSMIISNAVAAAALKAASDIVVDQNEFVQEALGIEEGLRTISAISTAKRPPVPQESSSIRTNKGSDGELFPERKETLLTFVRDALARSTGPLFLGALGGNITKHLGADIRANNWSGYGSLTDLLHSLEKDGEFQVIPNGSRSFIYDPKRHNPLPFEEMDHLAGLRTNLAQFIDRMSKGIALPRFSPAIYRKIFEAITSGLSAKFEDEFALTTRIVAILHDQDLPLSRQSIDFILTGLEDVGFKLQEGHYNIQDISVKFRDNVVDLCRNAQFNLSEEDMIMINAWLVDTEGSR
jgi:hypothetical protein